VIGWQTLSNSGVDGTFAGLLRCKDGILAIIDSGFCQQFRSEAEVVGAEGALIVQRPYTIGPESRIVLRRDREEEVITVTESDPYQCEVEALTSAVMDGSDLPVPLASSRSNVHTLVALYESARLGRPIEILEY
jgi:hypothetical protein